MEDIFNTQEEIQEEETLETTDELAENCESADESVEDTENPTENEQKAEEKADDKAETKVDKLNPYEKAILAEMQRRASGEDGDMPDDNLANGLASKDKNIHECFQYVVAQAKKKASGNCAMIEDSVVYGWAHHYYIEPKAVIDAELHPKPKDKPKADTKASTKVNGATKPSTPAKPKTESKPTKKATYADNPLLKSVMGKGKKTTTTTKTGDKVTQVKKGDRVFTITEFSLF